VGLSVVSAHPNPTAAPPQVANNRDMDPPNDNGPNQFTESLLLLEQSHPPVVLVAMLQLPFLSMHTIQVEDQQVL